MSCRPKEIFPYPPDFSSDYPKATQEKFLLDLQIAEVLHSDFFIHLLERIDQACEEHQVCAHDWSHLERVKKNALFLKELWPVIPSNEEIILATFFHDVAYALKATQWDNTSRTAVNHASLGAVFLEKVRRAFLLTWLEKQSNCADYQAFLSFTEEHTQLFFSTISSTTSTSLLLCEKLLGSSNDGKSEATFCEADIALLSVSVADKLDYFCADRIKKLLESGKEPRTYEENPFYFLCKAAQAYRLQVNEGMLEYVVDFQPNQSISTFAQWHTEAYTQYGSVWKLATVYAQLLNLKFAIIQESETEA